MSRSTVNRPRFALRIREKSAAHSRSSTRQRGAGGLACRVERLRTNHERQTTKTDRLSYFGGLPFQLRHLAPRKNRASPNRAALRFYVRLAASTCAVHASSEEWIARPRNAARRERRSGSLRQPMA